MNVYNNATGRGTLITLVLLAGALVLDVWLMNEIPILRHGLAYGMLQMGLVGLLLKALHLIFRRRSSSLKN